MNKQYTAFDFTLTDGVSIVNNKATITKKRDDLRLHLPFNDDLTDTSKYNKEVSSSSGTDNFVTGKVDKAIQVLYTNGYMSYPVNAFADVFNEDQAFSVAFWINADRYTGRTQVVLSHGYKSGITYPYFRIFMPHDRTYMKFTFNNDGTYRTDLQYNFDFSTSGWKHIVLRYDGSRLYTAGHLDLFVDGTDVTSSCTLTDNIGNNTFLKPDVPLTLLNFNPATGANANACEAKIDDVRVYSSALSQTEIDIIYNSGDGTEDNMVQTGLYKIEQKDYFNEPYLKQYDSLSNVITGDIKYTIILPDGKEYYTPDGSTLAETDGTNRNTITEMSTYISNLFRDYKLNTYLNYENIGDTIPAFTSYDLEYQKRASAEFTLTVDDNTIQKKTFMVGEKKSLKVKYEFEDASPVNIYDADTINIAFIKNDETILSWNKEDLVFDSLSSFFFDIDFSNMNIGEYFIIIEVKTTDKFIDISKNIQIELI